jgi:iron complex outermembrane recepter protein
MMRGNHRTLRHLFASRSNSSFFKNVPLAAALVSVSAPGFAQETVEGGRLENIIVTAQRRSEDLQDVPLSIQAFNTVVLEELGIKDFDDYVRFLPSVSYQTVGPGFAQVYMRGVASGGDGNHSGSLPSVGIYLDEQPITTIQGALDVHLYDIARVEALAGPQGTLYGASSQAGTLRIITNKPDATQFDAAYDLEGSTVSDGGSGYLGEGFVNVPLSENAAIRLVGWKRHDPGYIDNVDVARTFPSSGITVNNTRTKNDYNDVDTTGARAALKLDLGESWTITPGLMTQKQEANGTFGYDRTIGELQVSHRFPDRSDDRWTQAALTVEGKLSNFDLLYAGSYLKRDVDSDLDYSDYSFWYDNLYSYGAYFYDDDGALIDPSQHIQAKDRYKRYTHELRVSSPVEGRFRFVAGLFAQRQEHGIQQRYITDDFATALSVTGWPETVWLTEQERVDRDSAVFSEVSFDVTDALTVTGGLRYFKSDNSLKGFFGYSDDFNDTGRHGEALCSIQAGDEVGDTSSWVPFHSVDTAPCTNLDKRVEEKDTIHKLNVAYNFDEERMIYATWSRGYRPGGPNRNGTLPPYLADFLTNYEVGWKTTWADNRLRFNGAVFSQEWEDFQFSLLGLNGLTDIKNANQARLNGIEMDFSWVVNDALTLGGGAAWMDAELTENYCGFVDEETDQPVTVCPVGSELAPDGPEAPDGTQLPVTPKFKGNLTARYEFPLGAFDAHVQSALVYVGKRWADLRIIERGRLGEMPSYTTVDLSAGMGNGTYSFELFVNNATDERAEISRFAQCAEQVCGDQTYIVTNLPRNFGVRFGQKF